MTALAFSMLVPPRWTRFDLTQDIETELAEVGRSLVRRVPLIRQPVMRRVIDEQVVPAIRELAANGADCALMAVDPVDPNPLRPIAYFSTTTVDTSDIPGGSDAGAGAVLAHLGAEQPDAEVIAFGDLIGLRTRTTVDSSAELAAIADPIVESMRTAEAPARADVSSVDGPAELPASVETAARSAASQHDRTTVPAVLTARVRYLIGEESDAARWMTTELSLQFPDTPDGAALADSTIELFDAVVRTLRWDS